MFSGETPSTGSSASPGDVRLYPRVCLHGRYAPRDRFSPAEKTSFVKVIVSVDPDQPLWSTWWRISCRFR